MLFAACTVIHQEAKQIIINVVLVDQTEPPIGSSTLEKTMYSGHLSLGHSTVAAETKN